MNTALYLGIHALKKIASMTNLKYTKKEINTKKCNIKKHSSKQKKKNPAKQLECQTCAIACPAIQAKKFAPSLELLAEVFGNTSSDEGQGPAHDFTKLALLDELATDVICHLYWNKDYTPDSLC